MKRILFLLVPVFVFVANIVSAQTVYVTKTGTKYHVADCRYLSQSKIAIELKDAIERGYEPCKVCHPPTSIGDSAQKQTVYKPRPPTKDSNAQHVRTGCVCNDGTRSTATGRGACSHHGGVKYWLYK